MKHFIILYIDATYRGQRKSLTAVTFGVSLTHKIGNIRIRGFPHENKKNGNKILLSLGIESGRLLLMFFFLS